MSDEPTAHESGDPASGASARIKEARYSLKTMMAEVKAERKNATLGRELVDSTEISTMFSRRKRKKTKE